MVKKYVFLFLATLSYGSLTSNFKVIRPIQPKDVEELLNNQKRGPVPFAIDPREKSPFKAYAILSENNDYIYVENDKNNSMANELTIVGDREAVKARYVEVSPAEYENSCGERVTRYLARYELDESTKKKHIVGIDSPLEVEVVPVKTEFKNVSLPSELREYTKEHLQHSGYYSNTVSFDEVVNKCKYLVSQKFEEIRCGYISFFLDDRKLIGTTGADKGPPEMDLLSIFKGEGIQYYLFNIGNIVGTSLSIYSEDGKSVDVKNGNYEILCD